MLVSEIRVAIKELKNRKAVGINEIPAEVWKSLGKKATTELVELCERIYTQLLRSIVYAELKSAQILAFKVARDRISRKLRFS